MWNQDHCQWICWACQHPKCSGEGCEARQPEARIGSYTCEKCLYPPCHICKTTPRPKMKSNWNTCHNVPKWVCLGCKEVCKKCTQPLPRQEASNKRKYGADLCDACLYPPCPSCGKSRPHKKEEYSALVLPIWTCVACKKQKRVQSGDQ